MSEDTFVAIVATLLALVWIACAIGMVRDWRRGGW